MDKNLINHYKSMSSSELLSEIVKGRLGTEGSSNRDAANHILKIKEKEEEQAHLSRLAERDSESLSIARSAKIAAQIAAIAATIAAIAAIYSIFITSP